MNVAIIGCGLIGCKRALALGEAKLTACVDTDLAKAEKFAAQFPGCSVYPEWQSLMENPTIDIVIIAVPHYKLAEITLAAILGNKHCLVEKPAALSAIELEPVLKAQARSAVKVHVGFNHRYHRAFQKAKALVDANALGELMFMRGRYGHGGRLGYEKEWRAQKAISGGGELIDQGVHLIDLSRWFLGEFTNIQGYAHTYYWDMPVDDNGFMLLKTANNQVAFLHASCTEWKNLFSMEIYGKLGKIVIDGLGGSYGTERLSYYKMLPQMGPPETLIWEYPMNDNSWEVEFAEFLLDIKLNRQPACGLQDAYEALKITNHIYEGSGL